MRLLRNLYLGAVYLFLYVPIAVLVIYAFNDSRVATSWQGFTLRWFAKLAGNDTLIHAALNSILVGVLAATLATALGSLAAIAIYRYRFRGRELLSGGLYLLTVEPDIVMGISLMVLFVAIQVPLGFLTLLLAHVTFCLPFVALTVLARLQDFDVNMLEAAEDLGAGELEIVALIIVPLIWPAMLAGWLLSFTLSLDDVLVSFFTTGPGFDILPLRIYSMVKLGVRPEINALSAVLLAVTFTIVLAAQTILKKRSAP